MEFKFAHFTDVTDLAFKVNPHYKDQGYIKFFICPDVWDFWLIRVLEGFNEDYEPEEGSYLMEREKIPMNTKGEKLNTSKVKKILLEDDGGNYDYIQSYDLCEIIETIGGGFGILS